MKKKKLVSYVFIDAVNRTSKYYLDRTNNGEYQQMRFHFRVLIDKMIRLRKDKMKDRDN